MKALLGTLRSRRRVSAVHVSSGSPAVVEIVGDLGFSAVVIDARHAPVSPFSGELEQLLRAARAASVPALVRTPDSRHGTINRALNDGAEGILVPGVETRADAEAIVSAGRYPAEGRRGAAPAVRAAGYGLADWGDYQQRSNADRMLLACLETPSAVAAAADLLDVDGIDGVVVDALTIGLAAGSTVAGPSDLEGLTTLQTAASAHGKIWGVLLHDPGAARDWAAAGCQLVIVGDDLVAFAAELAAMRDAIQVVPRQLPTSGWAS